jgi:hypothetical protein
MIFRMSAAAFAVLAVSAVATGTEQPYAGFDSRQIKALSSDEIAALATGRGYSQALSAELNGYPGPRHVLELAERLGLDDTQRTAIQALLRDMQTEAIAVGAQVLAGEAKFEVAFRSGTLTEEGLLGMAEEIGRLRGKLRAVHLRFHLRTSALLSRHQIAKYNDARGYGTADAGPRDHGSAH